MKLKDIKPGMIVELSCGIKGIVINGKILGEMDTCLYLKNYDDDMKRRCDISSNYNIVKIYESTSREFGEIFMCKNLKLIWERKELPNFEHDEIIEVWDGGFENWIKRYFKEFDKNGNVICYKYGASSQTVDNIDFVTSWYKFRKWDKGE